MDKRTLKALAGTAIIGLFAIEAGRAAIRVLSKKDEDTAEADDPNRPKYHPAIHTGTGLEFPQNAEGQTKFTLTDKFVQDGFMVFNGVLDDKETGIGFGSGMGDEELEDFYHFMKPGRTYEITESGVYEIEEGPYADVAPQWQQKDKKSKEPRFKR